MKIKRTNLENRLLTLAARLSTLGNQAFHEGDLQSCTAFKFASAQVINCLENHDETISEFSQSALKYLVIPKRSEMV